MLKPLAGLAALFLCCTPVAAAPALSGGYLASIHQSCQLLARVDSTTGRIGFAGGEGPGNYISGPSTLSFNSSDGTYTWNGIYEVMANIFEKFSDGSRKGAGVKEETFTESGAYSNADATLTLNGEVWDVVYGHVDGNGVADNFSALLHPLARPSKDHCILSFDAQLQ